ncbi:MAG: HAD-IB family hydrolase [Salinisphaera sp.]|nr:HAD-IB family hydrolase [Salinisphaera sp.]
MNLAVFDLDNTLLAGDSDYLWGRFLIASGVVDGAAHEQRNRGFYADYQTGTLDIRAYQRFALQPLIDNPLPLMRQLRERFVREWITPIIAAGAPKLIERHRSRGDALLIITATNRFITEPIAALLGIDQLLATDPEIVDGRYTGEITGVPCFQKGKITRLEQWLGQHGPFAHITAYSDSHNDAPLLARADAAVAVDPDERLTQLAQLRGWRVVSLRGKNDQR